MKSVFLVLIWSFIAPSLAACATGPAILWLGVVREDRTIVPFARFDGSSWSNPWPAGEMAGSRTIPDTTFTLDRIPVELYSPLPRMPREWHVQMTHDSSTTARVTKPVFVYSWCQTFLGLLIGNARIPINTHEEVVLEGFAASSIIRTGPVIMIGKGSTEWDRILSLIRPAFEKAEQEHHHPLPPAERAKAEFSFARLVLGQPGTDGRIMAYFEVERDYTKTSRLPSKSEFSRSFMNGWIVMDHTGTVSFIEKSFRNKSDTDDMIVGRLNPLGTAVINGKNLWIVQFRGYEGESYSVLHVTPAGIKKMIVSSGGGC